MLSCVTSYIFVDFRLPINKTWRTYAHYKYSEVTLNINLEIETMNNKFMELFGYLEKSDFNGKALYTRLHHFILRCDYMKGDSIIEENKAKILDLREKVEEALDKLKSLHPVEDFPQLLLHESTAGASRPRLLRILRTKT
ncbi:hypothetical protein HHI36_014850 [Cryptolaemus montrouzieri]|uniref:Uncharacterized protein n=1 Tax=Cryptolaemus montrouzieri TaxID=559131 RepID=A0ABD2N4B9_9CUCU